MSMELPHKTWKANMYVYVCNTLHTYNPKIYSISIFPRVNPYVYLHVNINQYQRTTNMQMCHKIIEILKLKS